MNYSNVMTGTHDAGERDFTGVNLVKAKLIGANLVGINLFAAEIGLKSYKALLNRNMKL